MKRFAASIALAVGTLGAALVISPSVALAAVKHPTLTAISCPSSVTYGTSATCTITVYDVAIIQTKTTPTGTASVATILGRLTGDTCTLAALSSSSASCDVTVTAVDAGVMIPIPSYSGDSTHFLSIGLGALTATPADLTITAQSTNREYLAADPPFNVDYSGFKLSDGPADLLGTLSCTTTAVTSSPVGDYPITCSGLTSPTSPIVPNTAHYNITYVPGTLSVDKITLTITPHNKMRIYGASNPSFTVAYSGFVGGDDEGDLGGTLSCSTTADSSSPIGLYDIVCSGLTSATYNIVFEVGTLTVLSAPGASLPTGSAELKAGDDLVIDIDHWQPGSTVDVVACDGLVTGTIVVDGGGTGQGVFKLPSTVKPGECTIVLTGTEEAGNPAVVNLSVFVGSSSVLPRSGTNVAGIEQLGGLALISGGLLLLASRRRRPAV